MKCAIIGLGQVGKALAPRLAQNGVEVIAVDVNMDLVDDVKGTVALAVQMDASEEGALESQGIASVDVLISTIGANFEAEILIVAHAKKLGIPRVIARAASPLHAKILRLVGADEIISPEEEAAERLVQRLLVPTMRSYFELADGFSVVEIEVPAKLVGKKLREINLREKHRINLIAIKKRMPGTEPGKFDETLNAVPGAEDRIDPGDILAVVGNDLDLAEFMARYQDNP
ncbi:MAG: TrkA family potassium uptake protein [Planctomycetota bacterium]